MCVFAFLRESAYIASCYKRLSIATPLSGSRCMLRPNRTCFSTRTGRPFPHPICSADSVRTWKRRVSFEGLFLSRLPRTQ
eukprot:s753_g12.t1